MLLTGVESRQGVQWRDSEAGVQRRAVRAIPWTQASRRRHRPTPCGPQLDDVLSRPKNSGSWKKWLATIGPRRAQDASLKSARALTH